MESPLRQLYKTATFLFSHQVSRFILREYIELPTLSIGLFNFSKNYSRIAPLSGRSLSAAYRVLLRKTRRITVYSKIAPLSAELTNFA